MYFALVIPKRGKPYYAPSRDMCQGWRLQREAMAAADEKSLDDSVKCVNVIRPDFGAWDELARYIQGVRQ